jgi:hypothetical protein
MKEAIITKDFEMLLEDDDFEFYIGKNSNNEIILGHLISIERLTYLHILCDYKDLQNYFNGNISYLSLIKRANKLWLVDKQLEGEFNEIKQILFDDIPKEDLPLDTSFYLLEKPNLFK